MAIHCIIGSLLVHKEVDQRVEEAISPDMQLEDLLRIYDHEKIKFLSSFVGQGSPGVEKQPLYR